MSTPCTVIVEGLEPMGLYIHYDGDTMMPWLTKFNKQFTEVRGVDPEYKFAQLVRSSVIMSEEFNLNPDTVCGYGIVANVGKYHVDYSYSLNSDGTVTSVKYPKDSKYTLKSAGIKTLV